jgi:hypothetical protein
VGVLGNAPLYTRDWTLKPSGVVWQTLTGKTWRTDTQGVSGADGFLHLNAFYGTYAITVIDAGKTCETVANFTEAVETVRAQC